MWRVLLLVVHWLPAYVAAAQSVEMIADTSFQRGLQLKDRAGQPVEIRWEQQAAPPVWQTAQHHSKSCFADAAYQQLIARGFRFQDKWQLLRIHPDDIAADFVCGVNGGAEFGGQWRAKGDPWPHLYLEQKISAPGGHLAQTAPDLAALARLHFAINLKLLHDKRPDSPRRDVHTHAAQFLFFLTVQNLNRQSKGYGDYYWFGINLYDDRKPVTTFYAAQDKGGEKKKGTNKFIYSLGLDAFTKQVVAAGDWVPVTGDLLPHIVAGLQESWKRGYLSDSRELADYKLGGLVMGWEVTGLNDVAIAVKGLQAEAVLKPATKP
jgi:hypothetical protein